MRSIQKEYSFPLSSVKPLKRLMSYREHCLSRTRFACRKGTKRREISPVSGTPLEPMGQVDGFMYARCPESGSLFLSELPDSLEWGGLLSEISRYRYSPEACHRLLAQSRTDHVYAPKVEWIQETLALQGVRRARVLEVVTPPSPVSLLLNECKAFSEVQTSDEMALAHPEGSSLSHDETSQVESVLLLESLDRIDDPVGLLNGVSGRLVSNGLLFITALVASGFDMQVLGLKNLYLYPPDRVNCFSLHGLKMLLEHAGFTLLEVSTPGVLDVEIIQAHIQEDSSISMSGFERQIVDADEETREGFQAFLQQRGLSSFARIVARKRS